MRTRANQSNSKIEYLLQFALADWSTQKGNSAIVRQCELAQINQTPKLNICYSSHLRTGALKKVTAIVCQCQPAQIKHQNWIICCSLQAHKKETLCYCQSMQTSISTALLTTEIWPHQANKCCTPSHFYGYIWLYIWWLIYLISWLTVLSQVSHG